MGNGDGTFQSAVDYGTGTGPCSVAIQDLDENGDMDLAVANQVSDNVSILLGNGDGTFQPPLNFDAGDGPCSVGMGDLDGDGILDLGVANEYGDDVSVLLGVGDGTFSVHVTLQSADKPTSIAVEDLDEDGIMDLSVTTYFTDHELLSGLLSVFLGKGDGTFRTPESFGTESSSYSVAVEDLNGDINPDLAVASKVHHNVSVLLGNGDGTYQPAVNYDAGDEETMSVAIGDLNEDGNPDLMLANHGFGLYAQGSLSVLLGSGDGTFQPAVNLLAGTQPDAIAIKDLDGDSHLDLAVANQGLPPDYEQGSVSVLLGNGDGTFQPAVNYDAGTRPSSVAVGDLDRDGVVDLTVVNIQSHNISLLLGNGDGSFQPALSYEGLHYPLSVAVGDLDGDGNLDLAVEHDFLAVLLGNGDGTFQSHANYSGISGSVELGDLDGDGDLDLAGATSYGGLSWTVGYVTVLIGNGDGTFQAAQRYGSKGVPGSLSMEDLDGDSDLDLAETDSPSIVSIYLNNSGIAVCQDLDGDGYGDPASEGCSHVEWDCEDVSPVIHPGAMEICGNGVDENCDGIDPSCPTEWSTSRAAATVYGDGAVKDSRGLNHLGFLLISLLTFIFLTLHRRKR